MKKNHSIKSKNREYHLDAQGQSLGRFASNVAIYLLGKMETDYLAHKKVPTQVFIKNIDKLQISEKKLSKNVSIGFSGYHGGIKEKKWNEAFATNPRKFFLRVLKYMLPKNRQSDQLIKSVKFE